MGTYEIPRNVEGEGRILFIFSKKALIYTAIATGLGFIVFYLPFNMLGIKTAGIILTLICAVVGFSIGTFKVPEADGFSITRKTGGCNIDDVILRGIKFKMKKNRIYVYAREEKEDGPK